MGSLHHEVECLQKALKLDLSQVHQRMRGKFHSVPEYVADNSYLLYFDNFHKLWAILEIVGYIRSRREK